MKRSILSRLVRCLPLFGELYRMNDLLASIRQSLLSVERQLQSRHCFEVIRLLDFNLAEHPRFSDPKRLLRYGFQACSQNGEDGMIDEIFRRIGSESRVFVEIGIGNGNENNTAFLISQSWRGYWIDGSSEFLTGIRDRGWDVDGILKGIQAFVSRDNVANLFTEAGVPTEFDLLSIDIDQNTYHVWQALAGFRPRVVVVEYNAAFPAHIEWVVPYNSDQMWDGSQNFGASLKAFEKLAVSLGYHLVGCDFTGVNAFFVRKDLCADKFSSPFVAEHHYEPPRYSAVTRRSHPPKAFDPAPVG